jgi:hypothetical protein
VFDSDRNGNSDIYKMPAAGGEAIQLTTDPAGAYSAVWSPDGRQIAFHSMRAGNRDLYTMEADGSGVVQRTSSPAHELDPDWSRDGHALVAEVIPASKEPGAAATFVAASTFVKSTRLVDPGGAGDGRPIAAASPIRRSHPAAYPLRLHDRRSDVLLHHRSARKRHLGGATGGAVIRTW